MVGTGKQGPDSGQPGAVLRSDSSLQLELSFGCVPLCSR